MPELETPPGEWERSLEQSEFDSFMNREYTKIVFTHSPTERKLMINDVQEPNSFGGWGYLIHVNSPEHGELGLVEDLQTAKEIALDFMS